MLDLVSTAYAEAAAPGPEAAVGNIIFMLLLFGIFYFLLIRPQQKQAKLHKEMVENLQRGDSVITGGGLMGRIHRVDEDSVQVDVGEMDGKPVRVRVKKSTIGSVTAKAGPGGAPAQP